MPKRNELGILVDAKGKFINKFAEEQFKLDAEGRTESRKSDEIDAKIGKNQSTVMDIGLRPECKKVTIQCTKCSKKWKVYQTQIHAYHNERHQIVCNGCQSK